MNTTISANQALWEQGDFTRIAASMRQSGDDLVDTFAIRAGMRVLDLGCGDGTTALPAARRGAEVVGVDIARNLVEAGNRRAAREGLSNCRFEHGDAASLVDVADAAFDLTVSVFGAMFAPNPSDVAMHMVRVTRPGGRIIMGNWIPGDPTVIAELLKVVSTYTPPPPAGFVSPMRWGVESDVLERFTAAGVPASQIAFAKETFTFRLPVPAGSFLDLFRDYYGPTMNAFAAARKNGRDGELYQELLSLFERENRSTDGDTVEIPATFLRVTVTR